ICGILLLSFCLSSVSCKKKKEVFTHESIVSAAKSFGAEEAEDPDEIIVMMRRFEHTDGLYYRSADISEAQLMYDNNINRMGRFPSCHPRECTIFFANDETKSYMVVYMITTKKVNTAEKIYEAMVSERDPEDTTVGEKDGYEYALEYDVDKRTFELGFYRKENMIIMIRVVSKSEDSTENFEDFIDDLGLILPKEA
ncbi:MAG: hypothetical protein IK109_02030, partial [Clostridiales bacterium]|nr:hypothetical protein [Clostridiales bacterium]